MAVHFLDDQNKENSQIYLNTSRVWWNLPEIVFLVVLFVLSQENILKNLTKTQHKWVTR